MLKTFAWILSASIYTNVTRVVDQFDGNGRAPEFLFVDSRRHKRIHNFIRWQRTFGMADGGPGPSHLRQVVYVSM